MHLVRRVSTALLVLAMLGVVGFGVHLWASGYRLYIVHTGSMTPTLMPGAVVLDRPARSDYHVGQVITFRHSALTTDVVTHRVSGITSTGLVHTKGDANASADAWDIRPNQVKGVVTTVVPYAGYVIVFLRQPTGAAAAIVGIVAMVLLWRIFFPSEVSIPEASELREQTRSRVRNTRGRVAKHRRSLWPKRVAHQHT